MEDDLDGEKQNRVLLRPWLQSMLEYGSIPGLEWFDEEKTMFKVPWKHRSKKDWSMRHSTVFLEWAKNTGRWSEGDPTPNFAQLKTRLRCAFNKAPDIDEMKDFHCNKGEEPYKVYRFNTRRDVKSVFGRKTCQKTTGWHSQQSRSPVVMRYESCEEEVIDDDCAIYEEMEVHSTVLTSEDNLSNSGRLEDSSSQTTFLANSDFLTQQSHILTLPWTTGRGTDKKYKSTIEDKKSPVIPLSVELMTSSFNDDSDCYDADSSKTSKSQSVVQTFDSTTINNLNRVKADLVNVKENELLKNPASDESTNRIHLLKMASLFVEAAERKKQEENDTVEKLPRSVANSAEDVVPLLSASHYVIIMPHDPGNRAENTEQLNEGNITSGSEELVDVTKSTILLDSSLLAQQLGDHRNGDDPLTLSPGNDMENSMDSEGIKNCTEDGAYITQGKDGETDFTGLLSAELSAQDHIKLTVEQIITKTRSLLDWENHLKGWELRLEQKEKALYWREECLKSTFITGDPLNSEQCWNKDKNKALKSTESHDTPKAKVPITSFTSINPFILSKTNLSANSDSVCKIGNEFKHRLEQMIMKSSRISTYNANRVTSLQGTTSATEKNIPCTVSTNGLGSEKQLGEQAAKSHGEGQAINILRPLPMMSLVRPVIIPLPIGSQPLYLLPQQIVPVALTVQQNVSDDSTAAPTTFEAKVSVSSDVAKIQCSRMNTPETNGLNNRNLEPHIFMNLGIKLRTEFGSMEETESSVILPHKAAEESESKEEINCFHRSSPHTLEKTPRSDDDEDRCFDSASVNNYNRLCDSSKEVGNQNIESISDNYQSEKNEIPLSITHETVSDSEENSVVGTTCGESTVLVKKGKLNNTPSKMNQTLDTDVKKKNHQKVHVQNKQCQILTEKLNQSPEPSQSKSVDPRCKIDFNSTHEGESSQEKMLVVTVLDNQNPSYPTTSLSDFTKWLRATTETIYKEENQQCKKLDSCDDKLELCSDSLQIKNICTESNQSISFHKLVPFTDSNCTSNCNGRVLNNADTVTDQASYDASPFLHQQVPLVISSLEHNSETESDCNLETDSLSEVTPVRCTSSASEMHASLVYSRRKRSLEKEHSSKKIRGNF